MKKMIVLGLAVAALNSLNVSAATDSKYPAANFESSVIYCAKEVVGDPIKNEVDPKYPAANFTPIVLFVDTTLADQTKAQDQDETDPKYPAAYFKPRVIYP